MHIVCKCMYSFMHKSIHEFTHALFMHYSFYIIVKY